jgi:hypothetical protein
MSKKIVIAATGPYGAVFLEWSIYFLSGQESYFHSKLGNSKLVDNPLSNNSFDDYQVNPVTREKYYNKPFNAHGHSKNICQGLDAMHDFISQLTKENPQHNVVWHQMLPEWHTASKKLSIESTTQPSDAQLVIKQMRKDFGDAINLCLSNEYKVIYLAFDPRIPLYLINERRPHQKLYYEDVKNNDHEKILRDSLKKFLNWTDEELDAPIWDRREKLALDQRPYELLKQINIVFDQTLPYHHLNCQTLWFNGESEIKKIMAYLELSIVEKKLQQWLPIYQSWQKIQFDFLDFSIRVPDIIQAILNGWHYDIGTLTFEEEVVILHDLMYRHGLSIKSWQLDKLPTSAKILHSLLEPCPHKLEKIYN